LNRTGQTATDVYGPTDNLVYTYTGNQLNNVNDATGTAYQNNGFSDNGSTTTNEYLYDQNGNLTKDLNKQIDNIMYSPQNLPQRIDMITSGQPRILYVYDATGRKLRKKTLLNQADVTTTDYDGSFVYVGGALSYIITPEGRALPDGSTYKYEYHLKDHLGNTRVVFDQNGTVLQDNSYYPFGMSIDGLNYTNTAQSAPNKYLYNGKEMQDDFNLDWMDYGARMYDAVLGRWHSVDPLAEFNRKWSPYNYAVNNPIRYIDPDGMQWADPKKDQKIADRLQSEITDRLTTEKENLNTANNKVSQLEKKIAEKGSTNELENKLSNAKAELSSISTTISDLNESSCILTEMGSKDVSQVFDFNEITSETGGTEVIKGVITMDVVSDANAIHETKHGFQIYDKSISHDKLEREVPAYQSQFSFNPQSVKNNVPSAWGLISNRSDINTNWVMGIHDSEYNFIYLPSWTIKGVQHLFETMKGKKP